MFVLLAIIFLTGLVLYYVTTLDFEIGDGFTEEKKQAREAKYIVVKKVDANSTKLIE